MKIRHKKLGLEFEVKPFRDDVLIADGHYYETLGGSFIARQDSEYEVVKPPEVWVDVTQDCIIERNDWPRIVHKVKGGTSDVRQTYWYRISKIQLKMDVKLPPGMGMIPHPQEIRWAFVVEKRQP